MLKFKSSPLFNVDGAMGGMASDGTGASSNSQAAAPSSDSFSGGTPGWGMPNAASQAAPQTSNPLQTNPNPFQSAQPQAQTEFLDFAGRNVPVVDPVLRDIHKDYTNLQGTYTKTNQELSELRTRNQIYEQMIQQFQQGQQQQPTAQQNQPSAQDIEQAKEDFMNRFYEDPMAAIEEMVTKKVSPVIDPITKEREMNQEIEQLSGKYSDFRENITAMQAVIKEMPHLAKQGLETVYFVAKGRSAQGQPPAPSPEQLAQDPQFLQQYIYNNPQVTQQVVGNYVQNRQATNQQIPVVMNGSLGGQPPAMPENRPTTLGEGSKAFRNWLGR